MRRNATKRATSREAPPRNQTRERTRQSKTRYAWGNRAMNTRFGRSRTRYAPPVVPMNDDSDRGNDLEETNSARSFSPEYVSNNNASSDVSYGPPQPSQRRVNLAAAQVAQQRVRSSPPPNSPISNWRGPATEAAAGYAQRRRAASASPEASSAPSRAASASPGASAAPSRAASASPEASAAPSRAASASPGASSVPSSAASVEPENDGEYEFEIINSSNNNQAGGSKRNRTRKSKKSKKSKKRIVRPLKKTLSLSRSTR